MSNYNYYNNLTNRFKKGNTTQRKDKTYITDTTVFDISVYNGYNGEKTKSYTPSYEYKPSYGNTQNRCWES